MHELLLQLILGEDSPWFFSCIVSAYSTSDVESPAISLDYDNLHFKYGHILWLALLCYFVLFMDSISVILFYLIPPTIQMHVWPSISIQLFLSAYSWTKFQALGTSLVLFETELAHNQEEEISLALPSFSSNLHIVSIYLHLHPSFFKNY